MNELSAPAPAMDENLACLVRAAQSALASFLGGQVALWTWDEGNALSGSEGMVRASDASTLFPPEKAAVRPAEPALDALLREAVEPILVEQDPAQIVLGLPLGESGGRRLAATVALPDNAHDLALKLARLFLNDLSLRLEVNRYQDDLNTCAVQIGADFEELTFLRKLADHLDMSEVSQETWHVARMLLPLLASVIQAESLVLVTARQGREGSPAAVDRPAVWVGPRWLTDAECAQFIECFRREATRHPLVRNRCEETEQGRRFPAVRKFILVTIAKGDRALGWLLAINHVHQPPLDGNPCNAPLSQFEFGTVEAGLLSSVASMLATHAHNVELFREKEALLVNVVRAMVSAIDAKDPYTCGHSERVALVGRHLGQVLDLNECECERLYLAGLLHDLGKLGVPDAVLRKPDRLTEAELAQIKPHPEQGWAILQDLDQLGHLVPGVLHHHEHYDGTGYPDGLAGDAIPLPARILAVADSYDAMISDRPYRRGMPHDRVEVILREGAGTQWDPQVIQAFFSALPEVRALWQSYRPQRRARAVRNGELPDSHNAEDSR